MKAISITQFKEQNNIVSLGYRKSSKSTRYIFLPFTDEAKTIQADIPNIVSTKDLDLSKPLFVYSNIETVDEESGEVSRLSVVSNKQGATAETCEGFL